MTALRASLEHNGFVTVPNVLASNEIEKLTETLARFQDSQQNPHLAEVPEVSEIIFSDRIVDLAGELLDGEPMCFPDHTSQSVGGGFGYHKDSVDRWDPTGPDWQAEHYPMIRFGIYLEDFRGHSGSLAIQPGSHRGVQYARRSVNIKTKPGDLAAWYFTSTHAANSPSPRVAPQHAPRVLINNNRVSRLTCTASRSIATSRLGSRFMLPYTATRRVVFFPYALNHRLVSRYLSLLMHRDYYQKGLRSDPDQGARPVAAGQVKWFNPYSFLDRADPSLTTEGFYQGQASAAADFLADDIWREMQTQLS